MHKMAFHRARVLSIVESCLVDAGLELSPHPHIDADAERFLSERVAPPMRASRAEVFLPYSLPGEQDCLALDRGQSCGCWVWLPTPWAWHLLVRILIVAMRGR